MVEVLDLWDLFVNNVFGGFWISVVGIMILLFIIMAVLGKMSIYSVMWFMVMFLVCMALGYGATLITLLVAIVLIVVLYFAITSWIERS